MEGAAFPLDDPIYLGRATEQLSMLIEEQCAAVFQANGLIIPVKSCSLMAVLAERSSATAADLARALETSHQLILQKIPKLMKLGLIIADQDPLDARKKTFSVTPAGADQLARFAVCRMQIRHAYAGLFAEIGDVFGSTSRAISALGRQSISDRIPSGD